MSFLQPLLLFGLPLALLPVVIHLIHQHRHRTVRWAAMRFLLEAKRLTRGMARLRQIAVLAMRVLAVLALILAAGRPLAGGWVARVAGGAPETVLVLLDRSASMEEEVPGSGRSKRAEALSLVADLLDKTGRRSRVVLLDSATLEPTELLSPGDLLDLPATAATDTAADIPEMLERALDHVRTNRTGRTDVWILSDRRTSDWKPSSGRWETARAGFSELEGVRFHLLDFPERAADNLSVRVEKVARRQAAEGLELLLDFRIRRQGGAKRQGGGEESRAAEKDREVPLEITVNGVRTREPVRLTGDELLVQGHAVPLGSGAERGWGRVDLPADGHPGDNRSYFVYGEALPRRTVILSDDVRSAAAIEAAAASPVDPSASHEVRVLGADRQAEIPWEETALLFWQAPLPGAGTTEAALLRQFVDAGKSLVFLPPADGGAGESFHGFRWGEWNKGAPGGGDGGEEAVADAEDGAETETDETTGDIAWWRTDSDLLANTRSDDPLPMGELRVFRHRAFSGESEPLLRAASGEELVARLSLGEDAAGEAGRGEAGVAYAWGILPRADSSSLASDGVAFFAMVHRALERGTRALSLASARSAAAGALDGLEDLEVLDSLDEGQALGLRAGAFSARAEPGGGDKRDRGDGRLLALNRPGSEDDPRTVDEGTLAALFGDLDYRAFRDEADGGGSLASEIWRSLLVAMALALLAEALLCLPPRAERKAESAA